MICSVQELTTDINELVTLPDLCIKVTAMVEDDNSSIDDVAAVIAQDPSLTLKILKISNSAMYGFVSKIDTVARAVTLLGTRQVTDLVLATSAFDTFRGISNELVSMEDFWSHSILCGLAANKLSKICGLRNNEGLFVAGLLHDIGQLLLFNRLPEQSQQAIILSMEGTEGYEMHDAESSIIGFNHMELGLSLADQWNLPLYLKYCIGYHHHPDQAPDFKQEVSIINIANTIAVLAELNSDDPDLGPTVDDFAWQQTGLDTSVFSQVIESIADEYNEIETLLKM